jgi:hypothetical protein
MALSQRQRSTIGGGYSAPTIAPPPPHPPQQRVGTATTPTIAPPDDDLQYKQEAMDLINTNPTQPASAPVVQQQPVVQESSQPEKSDIPVVPDPAPVVPPAPPEVNPVPAIVPQLNQYGTYATPEQIAETLAAGETPFDMTGYTAPTGFQNPNISTTYSTPNGGDPVIHSQTYIDSGLPVSATDAYKPPVQWDTITPEMIEENRAYWIAINAQNQGAPATAEQIANAPHTPPGTTFPNQNSPANQYMGGPEQQYGPGTMGPNGEVLPDSYGYIRTEGDPHGEDEDNQDRILRELTEQINSGQGTTNWNPSGLGSTTGAPTGTTPPPTPPAGPPPSDPVYTPPTPPVIGGGDSSDGSSGSGSGVPGSEDDELRDLISDRASQDPTLGPMDDYNQVFEQGADALEARLQRSREQGMRSISERASERGVLGGSPELGMVSDLESELGVQSQEGLAQLNRERYGFALDARAQQLQKYGIDSNLAYNYAALEQDAGFKETAFDLQRSGMQMDEAYRYAAMSQDGNFQQQALNLQSQGMRLDDAFRYTALSQDSSFRQKALDLQSRGLDITQAHQLALLLWDKERSATEFGLAQQAQNTDVQRLKAQIMDMILRNELDLSKLTPEQRKILGL